MLCPSTNPRGACRMLVTLLYELESHLDSTEDSSFLQEMLMGNTLHVLIKIHDRLQRFGVQRPEPFQLHSQRLAQELIAELHNLETRSEVQELLYVLSKPHVQELLWVHDTVAQKSYDPTLPPLPLQHDLMEDSVRIIRLMKSKESLGATIKRDVVTGAIVVARIMRGGAADRSGLIHEGDELRDVNGVPVEDKNPEEIVPILAQSDGAVTFKVIPGSKDELEAAESEVFVRALFDYDPKVDPAIPCKDAGLEFRRGDVLQVVSQEDEIWWQARRIGDGKPRAGLIPSKRLQERRVVLQRPEVLFQSSRGLKLNTDSEHPDADYRAIHGVHIAGLRRSFRRSKKERWRNVESCGDEQIPSYQEVVPYVREPGDPYRPVVLVGPSGVGVTELKKKLLLSDPEHFAVPVPDTTRERRRHERDSVDYCFISKHAFEKDILHHKFIEYGEHGGNYYGVRLDSVRRVLMENKVCLLDLEPGAVETLYTAEFKPYVVFVKPPAIEQLRLSRRKAKILTGLNESTAVRTFSDEDFEAVINAAWTIEDRFGYLFDGILVNDDLAAAFGRIRAELAKLETETNWIPKTWTRL
ncbi:MAGUK p55 subfamily member 7 [Trichomycterus rosablanca]|uniref:MAGUK p55 subfamily member 7 n=1 Tax=Trichomycterus rosablanca TaxID=2290929 RepID=UPI002F35D333